MSVSLRGALLPVADRLRGLADTAYGLRLHGVSVVVTVWPAGSLPGAHGVTPTTTTTPLLVDGARPRVERVSSQDVIASGGRYEDADIKVGPLTPAWTDAAGVAHGVSLDVINPPIPAGGGVAEVLFKVTGPGIPAAGDWYRRVGDDALPGLFGYTITLRKVASA